MFDLSGCTLSKFFRGWSYIREVAHMGQAYYPEVLGKLCFVKAPSTAVWAVDKVKLVLNAATREKVRGSAAPHASRASRALSLSRAMSRARSHSLV